MKRFLQSSFWAEFKGNHGWKSCPVKAGETTYSVLIRQLNLKYKKASIAYIPMAPECSGEMDSTQDLEKRLSELSAAIKPQLPSNTFCIRFDPAMDFETPSKRDEYVQKLTLTNGSSCLKKPKSNIQPPDTTVLSLVENQDKKTDEQLLSVMKSKWRYNIKLASKKGVEVHKFTYGNEGFHEAFENFYSLFQQTSQRDGVQFHSKKYYEDLLQLSSQSEKAKADNVKVTLYLAKHEDDYLAGIITLFCGTEDIPGEAVYLYGASGNIKRNLMPAYLLQWNAIQDARQYGCLTYDFYGMPPTDDENHPMHGLYLFKTGFGGKNIHRPGSFDAVLNKTDYRLYTAVENLRAFYYKVIVKKLHGR